MIRKKTVNFMIMQFLLWGSWATFGQFYTYFLIEHSYNSAQIGIIITISTVAGLFGQYIWGLISDYTQSIKKNYIVLIIVLIGFVILFSLIYKHPFLIYLTVAGIGFTFTPQEALLDGWTLSTDGISHLYGIIRSIGSLGFALICLFFGRLISLCGWSVIFYSFAGLALVDAFVVALTKDTYRKRVKSASASLKVSLLFKDYRYVLLLIFAFTVNVGNSAVLTFLPFVFKGIGGSQVHLGYAAALAAFVEIPFFIVSSKLTKKMHPNRIFLFAAVAYILRVAFVWTATNPFQVIIASGIQAIGFSLTLATGRIYIAKIAPESLKTTAQTIFSACYFGLAGIIASMMGGYIINAYGMNSLFLIAEIFMGLGFILMLVINLVPMKEKMEINE